MRKGEFFIKRPYFLLAVLVLMLAVLPGCSGKKTGASGGAQIQPPRPPEVKRTVLADKVEVPWSPLRDGYVTGLIMRHTPTDTAVVYLENDKKKAAVVRYAPDGVRMESTDVGKFNVNRGKKIAQLDENRYVSYDRADNAPKGMFGEIETLVLADARSGSKKMLATAEAITRPGDYVGIVQSDGEKAVLWLETRLMKDECLHLYLCGMGIDSGRIYEYHLIKGIYSGTLKPIDARVAGDQIWVAYSSIAPSNAGGRAAGSTDELVILKFKEAGFSELYRGIAVLSAGRAVFLPDPEGDDVLVCEVDESRENPQLREWRQYVKISRWKLEA